MKDLERIFKALADETRLRMLALLFARGELCVCDFIVALAITQSKASRHLRYLANAGLVRDRRDGVWVLYGPSPDPPADIGRVFGMLRDLFATRRPDVALERLEDWLRSGRRSPLCVVPRDRKTDT